VKGGTLTVGILSAGNAETVDPRKAIQITDYSRTDNLFDPLFFQVAGGVAPGLATSAEPNHNATVWTLKLRDGVTWHDGKPFTADDVVYTFKNSWGSKLNYYYPIATSIVDTKNVRKLDKLTVQVPLKRPLASFPALTSWYNAYVIQDGTTNFSHPIGTGPFKYASFNPGSNSTFHANQDYWRGKVYVDQLVIDSSFQQDPARLNALLSGQIDIAPGVPPALAKANASTGKVVLGNSPGPAFISIALRADMAPFTDPRVIQALKLLTNRSGIVEDAFDGYATLGNDLPGSTLPYYASDIKPEYDPEKAKSLLKAAGHESLTLPVYTSDSVPGMVETATLWTAQAKAAGVNAQVKQLAASVFFTEKSPGYATNQRPAECTYWNVMPPALGPFYLEALYKTAVYPETGWGLHPGQDNLINDALGELNATKAKDKWHAVQEQQVKSGGYIVPANFTYLDAYSPKVHGVETNASGNCANYTFYKGWLSS
jgi:peptide/nickel transport system substrate-binding protein